MSVSITVNIAKVVVGPNEYRVTFEVASTTNIDTNVFVLDFPGLLFHQVAAPYSIVNYPVYDLNNPPPARTKYVRTDSVVLSFPNPSRAMEGIATVKADLKTLCVDWNSYNLDFSGNEQFVASVV